MIILDSLPASKASGTETGPSTGRPSGLDTPPPYLPHHHQADSDTASETTTHVEKVNKRKQKRRRKWILIFVGFVLYTAGLTTLLALKPWRKSSVFDSSILRFKFWDEPPMPPTYSPVSSTVRDGTALFCKSWDSRTSSLAHLQYQFPSNITDMFLNSCESPSVTGALYVRAGPDAERIVVDVEIHGQSPFGDEHLDVCMMARPGIGNYGIGIYDMFANGTGRNPPVNVLIHVVIPHNTSLASLCTYLPQFSQSLGIQNPPDHQNIPNHTYPLRIGSLSLGGPVSRLAMQMGEVKKFELDIDAPLRGHLCVSESLSVTSRSSDVSANITLMNRGNPITVNLEADHAPIDTIVKIMNLDTHGHATIPFPVHMSVRTAYAPLGIVVDYPASSPPVALFVEAETELAPVIVQLPPAFQGTFNLSATQSDTRVEQSTVRDPSGKGRTRTVYAANGGMDDQVWGSVSWNYLDSAVFARLGRVDVSTTLAQGIVELDQGWSDLLSRDVWPPGFMIR